MNYEIDYYAILGVSRDVDLQAIKQAYRYLARRFHPDVNNAQDASERFMEIQEAYEVLLDPQQRQAYDHWREKESPDRPQPLILRATASHMSMACAAEPQSLYVLIEILASEMRDNKRIPLNLCLVLDRSTSMKGARLHQVKEAARLMVDHLEADDILSLVVFSDRAQVVLPGCKGIDKVKARAAISAIRSGGGTEIHQGLNLGFEEVQRWRSVENASQLILLTDGQTYGDEEDCRRTAQLAGEHQIPITAMGIGSDWNDALLDEIAMLSNAPGSAIYIDSTSKISEVFQDQFENLEDTFAQNLVLSIHQSEAISLRDVHLVSPHISQLFLTGDQIALGSLKRQRPKAIMIEALVACPKPSHHRLLQVEIEASIPSFSHQRVRARQTVSVDFVTELQERHPIPSDIVAAMGKLTIVKMQDRVMKDVEVGQIEPAVKRLKTLATRLLDIGETELARAALLEAGRLAQTGTLSAEGRKKIRYGTRGLRIVPKEIHHD